MVEGEEDEADKKEASMWAAGAASGGGERWVELVDAVRVWFDGRRGGGDIVNYGPINLQPASTDVYGALSSQLMGGVR